VADQAEHDMGLAYELEKITEVKRFADFGVKFTPSLDEAKKLLS
jgi:hypothetical protein